MEDSHSTLVSIHSIHALKNVGFDEYNAIIYENKASTKPGMLFNGEGPPTTEGVNFEDIDLEKIKNIKYIDEDF